jgi:hypothetical protein
LIAYEVIGTLTEDQKRVAYYLIGFAINNNIKPYLICNYDNGNETKSYTHRMWPIFKTFTNEQKDAVSYMVDKVLKGRTE